MTQSAMLDEALPLRPPRQGVQYRALAIAAVYGETIIAVKLAK